MPMPGLRQQNPISAMVRMPPTTSDRRRKLSDLIDEFIADYLPMNRNNADSGTQRLCLPDGRMSTGTSPQPFRYGPVTHQTAATVASDVSHPGSASSAAVTIAWEYRQSDPAHEQQQAASFLADRHMALVHSGTWQASEWV